MFNFKGIVLQAQTVLSPDFTSKTIILTNIFKIENLTTHSYGIGNSNKNVAINDFFYRKKWSGYGPLGTHIDPEGKDKKYTIKTSARYRSCKKGDPRTNF